MKLQDGALWCCSTPLIPRSTFKILVRQPIPSKTAHQYFSFRILPHCVADAPEAFQCAASRWLELAPLWPCRALRALVSNLASLLALASAHSSKISFSQKHKTLNHTSRSSSQSNKRSFAHITFSKSIDSSNKTICLSKTVRTFFFARRKLAECITSLGEECH